MGKDFCATPYDTGKPFFYFNDLETLERLKKKYDVEEVELSYQGSEDNHIALFDSCYVTSCNFEEYVEYVEGLSYPSEVVALIYLVGDLNYSLKDAKEKLEDVCVYPGRAIDYAYDFIDDCYDLDKTMGKLAVYFDYDSFTRDLILGGDVCEVEFANETFTITNANGI
jgi:hypothetical protein